MIRNRLRPRTQRPAFLSRLAAFFSACVFCGCFLVCFLASWVLPMVVVLVRGGCRRETMTETGVTPARRTRNPRAVPAGSRRMPYFFLVAAAFALVACWAVTSACFFLFAPSVIVCFCVAFFCVDFGDLSPMIVVLSLSLLASGAGIAAGA